MIGRNWPKCQFLGQNGQILVKKGQKYFCQNFHWVIIVIDHKCSLNAKLVKSYEQIERNWPKCQFFGQKCQFFGQKCQFFGQKWSKNGQNRFFPELSLGNSSIRP